MPEFFLVPSQAVVDNLGDFGCHSCAWRVLARALVILMLLLSIRRWRRRDDQNLVDVVVVQLEVGLVLVSERAVLQCTKERAGSDLRFFESIERQRCRSASVLTILREERRW